MRYVLTPPRDLAQLRPLKYFLVEPHDLFRELGLQVTSKPVMCPSKTIRARAQAAVLITSLA